MATHSSWLNRLFSADTYNLSTSVQPSTNSDLFGIQDLDKALAGAGYVFFRVIEELEHAMFMDDLLSVSLKPKVSPVVAPRAVKTTNKLVGIMRKERPQGKPATVVHVQSKQTLTPPSSGSVDKNLPGSFPDNAKNASPTSLNLAPISLERNRSTSVGQMLILQDCPLDMINERIAQQLPFSEGDKISLRKYFSQAEESLLTDFDRAIECLNEQEGQLWGMVHRYDDPTKLRLALAIAIYQVEHPNDEHCTKEMLEIIFCVNKPEKLSEQSLNECIDKMPSKDQIDYLVFELAPEPKGGEEWGKENRYNDRNRLRDALIKHLENLCYPLLAQYEV